MARRASIIEVAAPLDGPPPFGAHALPAILERLRRFGIGLGRGLLARWATSLIRRACVLGRSDPFDIEPFPGQCARLYPRDNLSEKRVFSAVQFWDWAERAALARAAAARPSGFRFVDAGSNVGLYTLAARSAAHGDFRALAIEPDAENLRRLRFNLAASGAGGAVTVAPVALSDKPGEAVLGTGDGNRGEIALGGGTGVTVPTQPLLDLVQDAGFDRIDALKIDIEGMEAPVLAAFYATAPTALWPAIVLIEARRGAATPALAHLRATGYVELERTKMNVILGAPEAGWPQAQTETGGAHGKA